MFTETPNKNTTETKNEKESSQIYSNPYFINVTDENGETTQIDLVGKEPEKYLQKESYARQKARCLLNPALFLKHATIEVQGELCKGNSDLVSMASEEFRKYHYNPEIQTQELHKEKLQRDQNDTLNTLMDGQDTLPEKISLEAPDSCIEKESRLLSGASAERQLEFCRKPKGIEKYLKNVSHDVFLKFVMEDPENTKFGSEEQQAYLVTRYCKEYCIEYFKEKYTEKVDKNKIQASFIYLYRPLRELVEKTNNFKNFYPRQIGVLSKIYSKERLENVLADMLKYSPVQQFNYFVESWKERSEEVATLGKEYISILQQIKNLKEQVEIIELEKEFLRIKQLIRDLVNEKKKNDKYEMADLYLELLPQELIIELCMENSALIDELPYEIRDEICLKEKTFLDYVNLKKIERVVPKEQPLLDQKQKEIENDVEPQIAIVKEEQETTTNSINIKPEKLPSLTQNRYATFNVISTQERKEDDVAKILKLLTENINNIETTISPAVNRALSENQNFFNYLKKENFIDANLTFEYVKEKSASYTDVLYIKTAYLKYIKEEANGENIPSEIWSAFTSLPINEPTNNTMK